jgi:Ca-activated chloride channel homolog
MEFRKVIFATAVVSLLVGSAPSPLLDSAGARSIAHRLEAEPLCKIHEAGQRDDNYRPIPTPMPPQIVAPTPPPPTPPSPTPYPQEARAPDGNPENSIVVTGARREMTSQDVPLSVSVVSEERPYNRRTKTPASAARSLPKPPSYGGYVVLPPEQNREQYDGKDVAGIKTVSTEPVSTFAVDVDTGAYSNVRRFLNQGQMPPEDAVRTEEMVNYFRYDYALPKDRSQPFSVNADMALTPWNADSRLLRVGLRGFDLDYSERPAANLVFLVDVSGSMNSADKLPLVKSALSMLADNIRPQDRVSIVVYAGHAGLKLSPCNRPEIVKAALDQLQSGGSTAGGEGLKLAYSTARQNYAQGGVNRIIVATDGDFNVGITDRDELKKYVEKQRDGGITLTTLGFGTGNYNEALMEQIANVGNGNYAYIDSALEARKVLNEEMSSTLFTIAKDVKIQIEFNPSYVSEYRLIGYKNRLLAEEDFDNDKIDAGEIGAGHQVTAIYEIIPKGAKGWLPNRRYEGNKVEGSGKMNGELGFVKLRYKLPDGDTSRLIERPLTSTMLANASRPSGDMAFATAVAAFGQRLRGDKYLGSFSYNDIRALAGKPGNYWRQEFVKLTELAESGG